MLDRLFQFPNNALKEKKGVGEEHEVTESLLTSLHVLPDHLAKQKIPLAGQFISYSPCKCTDFGSRKLSVTCFQGQCLRHGDPEVRISQTVQETSTRKATFPGNCFVRRQPPWRNIWGRKNLQTKHF